MLKIEKYDLQISYENMSAEKDQLQNKVAEFETEKATTKEREKQYQIQVVVLEEQNTSLTTSLKDAIEQKTDFQPLKAHVLTQRRKIHQLQMCIEEERCKILQIDNRLEEISETTSYFLDRSQEIMEILMGRIMWIETNKETLAELPVKDQRSLKQEYDLLEFAINVVEEFKKTVKKTRGACAEYCRRVLATYNRCQISAERRLDTILENKVFIEHLQNRCHEDEQEI